MKGASSFQTLSIIQFTAIWQAQGLSGTHAQRDNNPESVSKVWMSGWNASVRLNNISVGRFVVNNGHSGVIMFDTGWRFGSPNFAKPRKPPANDASNCGFANGGVLEI